MTLDALLMAVALAVPAAPAAAGQEPGAVAPASYRATVSLDEGTRQLRGRVTIVVRAAARASAGPLRFAPGSTTVDVLTVDGVPAGATDSAGWPIAPLGPGTPADSLMVEASFSAADGSATGTSTAGAEGREYDFHDWLPRLVPAGRSLPLLATYLVTLDLPEDEIVAATGVPLCGDPGWSASRRPAGRPVALGRTAYASPRDPAARALPAGTCDPSAAGRKTTVWYAEDVRGVAVRVAPDWRYEEGDFLERPVHVLYPAGQERTSGAGVAVRHSETALAWLHEVFDGPAPDVFPWPQTTTVVDRAGAGRVDAMIVASPSAGQERLLLDFGRLYLGVAIAVPAADRAWLEEGLARFQADLYFETQGRRGAYERLERSVLDEELDGRARPVLPADAAPGGDAASRRAELLFHQLRQVAGDSATFAVLKAWWARARLREASESLFVAVADSIAGDGLGGRLAAALRDAEPVDYAVGGARREQLAGGRWRTTVEVRRLGGAGFPVEVRVEAPGGPAVAWAPGIAARETVAVETATRPGGVRIDPRGVSHDWNVLNNRKAFGFHPWGDGPATDYLDTWFTRPSRRDRLALGWAPVAWYNDAGGWTAGLRRREDYLGRFDLDEQWLTFSTGARARPGRQDLDWRVVLRNPTWLRSPGLGERLEAGIVEGRGVASLGVDWNRGAASAGLTLGWVAATTTAYLDPAFWERAATVEATARGRVRRDAPGARAAAGFALTGGLALRRASAPTRRTREPFARITADAEGERVLGRLHFRARLWAGAALASGTLPRQRLVYFAGPDPYQVLDDPFLRSRGALLLRPGFHYHEPGGAGLRGFAPTLAGRQGYGLSLETERDLVRPPERTPPGLFQRIALALFGDGALGDGDLDASGGGRLTGAADAGVGLRADHRIGATAFQTRLDFPLVVSAPALARDTGPGTRRFGFRWTCSLAAAF